MNRLNFNQTGGFPLSTNILDAMQEAYSLFNSLGSLAGDKVIISGCVQTGTNVSDGFIVINGEVLPFKGGTLGDSVIIKEEITEREFKNKSRKPVFLKRTAVFGSSTPEKTFAWSDFKRFDNLLQTTAKTLNFEKRLKALENKKSPVPIGLIAIWGKPASEPIPEGWRECTDLRGRFPLGWNPNDTEFNELLKEGGDKTHRLTIEEMPSHHHQQGSEALHNTYGGGTYVGGRTYVNGTHSAHREQNTSSAGGNQPHNNMPPYRIIKFIEFVGFENE